jgi:beta-glucosidase
VAQAATTSSAQSPGGSSRVSSGPEASPALLKFPKGFLWGTATSTTQIEGHIQNEWTGFVASDGRTCHPACDSYHRYKEDIAWMKRLHVSSYRMGVEWSRLQSHPFGPLNGKELARYTDQLDALNAAGITPMVVLHHFSNPNWINEHGGWVNAATVPAFVDYASRLVDALRDRVRIWNTFNEPDTYACCGYLLSQFPPLKRCRFRAYRRVIRHTAEAHHRLCQLIREKGSPIGPVEVGFSKNWTWFQAHRRSWPWDRLAAWLSHRQFNSYVIRQFLCEPRLRGSTFLGLNYYGRVRFKHFRPLVPAFGYSADELAKLGVSCDDMLERHPDGLEETVGYLHRRYKLPLYLTEHGSASLNEDFRERDLKENLAALHGAIRKGADVRGFYYWSLLDNFEWQFGYSKKFGLIAVDFDSQSLPRAMKHLGTVYSRICLENGFRPIRQSE